ncbi:hypothetical protein PVAP13_2NG006521 [Panicum virgatum]|uniref:3'-5' exonuclease domain-containing protein n=1 Tax=Panicum virgatum TaxID=38727 RepID=A0A8T0VA52_PANVG|nr:hypothetical protein PVAP13_2NG006521 [Panicum virgatum]
MGCAIPVSIRLRRSTPSHDAYTVRVYDRRFTALATARPADARRFVATTRWLHGGLHHQGRLVVGLGVQWTPTRLPLHGAPPEPTTLQLCVGHRCLLFHLAHADAVPEALRRFLADPRVTFVGSGSANDRRMLWEHYGLHVERGLELRAVAAMGNASLEDMADRFLGYTGIRKPREVAMSAWHAPRLSPDQVQYSCVDAYLAFRLGLVLCPPAEPPRHPALPPRGAPPPARHQQRAPAHVQVWSVHTDDEEDEGDGYMGSLGAAADIDSNGDDQEDEEGCNGDDQEDEEGCNVDDQEDEEGCNGGDQEDEEGYEEYTGTGISTDDNKIIDCYGEFVSNWVAPANVEDGGGHQAYEYLGHSEVVLDNGEDALAQDDDWYDQEVDYGCDQDDEDEYGEFYLL